MKLEIFYGFLYVRDDQNTEKTMEVNSPTVVEIWDMGANNQNLTREKIILFIGKNKFLMR